MLDLETLQNNIVLVAVGALLLGLFLGWLLTYLLIGRGPSKTELTGKLAAVEEEFDSHKENVDKHFEKTSELVNELTESYVKVYKHLSDGAEQLSGVVDMRNRLTLDEAKSAADDDQPPVIEGALAATATLAATDADTETATETATETEPQTPSAEVAKAEDPEFTVSDEAVEETLSELEESASQTPNPDKKA